MLFDLPDAILKHNDVKFSASGDGLFSEGDDVVEPRFARKAPCCLNNK